MQIELTQMKHAFQNLKRPKNLITEILIFEKYDTITTNELSGYFFFKVILYSFFAIKT